MNTVILQLTAMLPERHHISWCTSFHVTHWLNSLRNDHHQEEETRASAEVTLNYTTAAQKRSKREEGEGHKLMQRWAQTGDIRLQVGWCHFLVECGREEEIICGWQHSIILCWQFCRKQIIWLMSQLSHVSLHMHHKLSSWTINSVSHICYVERHLMFPSFLTLTRRWFYTVAVMI